MQAADGRAQAKAYRFKLTAVDGAKPFDDVTASELAKAYAAYLIAAHMLLPGDLAGSPEFNFSHLPAGAGDRRSLRAEMRRLFEAYKEKF